MASLFGPPVQLSCNWNDKYSDGNSSSEELVHVVSRSICACVCRPVVNSEPKHMATSVTAPHRSTATSTVCGGSCAVWSVIEVNGVAMVIATFAYVYKGPRLLVVTVEMFGIVDAPHSWL